MLSSDEISATSGVSSAVLCHVEHRVATVTLNRPDRNNGWGPELETAYFDALSALDDDEGVRAIVVTGAGRSFCPGFDAEALAAWSAGGAQPIARTRPIHFPLSVRKPLIAAINGGCAGIGLYQALLCDLRFAAAPARLSTAWSRRGLVAEHGESALLSRLVGHGVAADLLLSSRVLTGAEAARLGLVNSATDADELIPTAIAYARELADNCSPRSMAQIKRQLAGETGRTLEASLAEAQALMADPDQKLDSGEGIAALLERRAPDFAPLASRGGRI